MAQITKTLSSFVFSGTDLVLASAGWKGNVRTLYGFNAAGTSYTSFKPGSNFNALTKLVQNGFYILDAAATEFDLPGAMMQAGSAAEGIRLAGATEGVRAAIVGMAPRGGDGQFGTLNIVVVDADENDLFEDLYVNDFPADSGVMVWNYRRGFNEEIERTFLITATFSDGSTLQKSLTVLIPGNFQ